MRTETSLLASTRGQDYCYEHRQRYGSSAYSHRDRNFTLRPGDRITLDRRDEINGLRGSRHSTARDSQPARELGLLSSGRGTVSDLLGVIEIALRQVRPRISGIASLV